MEHKPTSRVLVVDDDPHLRPVVRAIFERSGWEVDEAGDGREALRLLYARRPDAILLDIEMPGGIDGWETLSRIRDIADTPVLMLSGLAGELEKVRALRAGADDYVTKPFGRQELVARTEAVLRRSSGSRTAPVEHYDDGVVRIDYGACFAEVHGSDVTLTPLELRLLKVFVEHPDQVLSWPQLLELAWRDGIGTRDQVKVYVGYLRRKLGDAGSRIETVRGFGYRYRIRPMRSA